MSPIIYKLKLRLNRIFEAVSYQLRWINADMNLDKYGLVTFCPYIEPF